MKWHDGLDRGLAFSLAVVVSTPLVGPQLWGRVVGPPSSGKTQIAEGIMTCRKWVFPASQFSGFHSGWKGASGSGNDHGLIPKIKNKTMVTKDGDTIMTMPNREQVMGQARDLYDGSASAHYKNEKSFDHVGLRASWLIYATEAIREMDNESDLGGRFLDCVLMDSMREDDERAIRRRVVLQRYKQITMSVEGRPETDGPEMTEAKRLTGGYVQYLRENGKELYEGVRATEDQLIQIGDYGEFISFMRARPSGRKTEKAQRELSFRLADQMVKLSLCLCVVLGKTEIDSEVIRRVRQIGLDTCRGRALEIARHLWANKEGLDTHELHLKLVEPKGKVQDLLTFMRKIGAIGAHRPSTATSLPRYGTRGSSGRGIIKWRLTPRIEKLYQEILGD